MNFINIVTYDTSSAEKLALDELSRNFVPEKFFVEYDKMQGLPKMLNIEQTIPETFPLIILGKKNNIPVAIQVYCLTCGYEGVGPRSLLRVLQATGFPVDPEAILTEKFAHNGKICIEGTALGVKSII